MKGTAAVAVTAIAASAAVVCLLRLRRRRRGSAEYWRTLERGHYLPERVSPPELIDAIVGAMQDCLEARDFSLAEIHKLRKVHAKAACAGLQTEGESSGSRKERLARAMRQVAVCTGPNFKDQLRAHVLASSHFPKLLALSRQLVHEHVLPHVARELGECSFAVQCRPSMRFNLPGSSALGARPDDNDEMIGLHTDAEYGHQRGEMNFALALTPIFGTNGLFIESEPGLGDFREVNMGVGDIFAFGGVSRRHHNKRNTTEVSRVSLDFRVIPMSRYDSSLDHERKSTRAHRFTLGEYFELITV